MQIIGNNNIVTMFKKNIGSHDRAIRIILGFGIIGAGVYFKSWLGAIGALPLLTAALGTCPLYSLLGMSTCPVDNTPKT